MYAKSEHMPEHFAFCAFKGSGAADDVQYVEGVKQLEGSLSELKVADVADVVEPHPSLEHPIAGYQLVGYSMRRAAGAGARSRRRSGRVHGHRDKRRRPRVGDGQERGG